MLTESEREWLEQRKPGDWCAYINCSAWCDRKEGRSQTPYCVSQSCYLDQPSAYRDAAEFEGRVAARLALWEQELLIPCMETALCERHPADCAWCKMKYARLAVEEEMEGDGQ